MRKGLSPVVATVILISISFTAGIIIYWWATGYHTQFPTGPSDDPYEIDVNAINWTSGEFSIVNRDSRDSPATTIFIAQNKSRTCSVPALGAGQSHTCTFGSGLSGTVTFMGKKTTQVTLVN